MSHPLIQTRWVESAADTPNIDASGGEGYFQLPYAFRVLKVGVRATTAVDPDNATALTVNVYRNPTALSETNRELIGTLTVRTANQANLGVGSMVFKDLHVDDADGETAEDGTQRNVAPVTVFSGSAATGSRQKNDIYLGESLQLEVPAGAEADSGAVISFIEVVELGADPAFWGTAGTALPMFKDVTQDISTNPSVQS